MSCLLYIYMHISVYFEREKVTVNTIDDLLERVDRDNPSFAAALSIHPGALFHFPSDSIAYSAGILIYV